MRGELKGLNSQLEKLKEERSNLENEFEILTLTNTVLSSYVEDRLESFCKQIEETVNEGLKFVFDDDVSIILESSIKRGKAEYKILVNHKDVVGSRYSFGGGVVAIVSFIIRVVLIALSGRMRFVVSDESLAFVSIQYQEKLSRFIRELCDKMDFDVILITHQPALATYANKSYVVEQKNGETKFIVGEH